MSILDPAPKQARIQNIQTTGHYWRFETTTTRVTDQRLIYIENPSKIG